MGELRDALADGRRPMTSAIATAWSGGLVPAHAFDWRCSLRAHLGVGLLPTAPGSPVAWLDDACLLADARHVAGLVGLVHGQTTPDVLWALTDEWIPHLGHLTLAPPARPAAVLAVVVVALHAHSLSVAPWQLRGAVLARVLRTLPAALQYALALRLAVSPVLLPSLTDAARGARAQWTYTPGYADMRRAVCLALLAADGTPDAVRARALDALTEGVA